MKVLLRVMVLILVGFTISCTEKKKDEAKSLEKSGDVYSTDRLGQCFDKWVSDCAIRLAGEGYLNYSKHDFCKCAVKNFSFPLEAGCNPKAGSIIFSFMAKENSVVSSCGTPDNPN